MSAVAKPGGIQASVHVKGSEKPAAKPTKIEQAKRKREDYYALGEITDRLTFETNEYMRTGKQPDTDASKGVPRPTKKLCTKTNLQSVPQGQSVSRRMPSKRPFTKKERDEYYRMLRVTDAAMKSVAATMAARKAAEPVAPKAVGPMRLIVTKEHGGSPYQLNLNASTSTEDLSQFFEWAHVRAVDSCPSLNGRLNAELPKIIAGEDTVFSPRHLRWGDHWSITNHFGNPLSPTDIIKHYRALKVQER